MKTCRLLPVLLCLVFLLIACSDDDSGGDDFTAIDQQFTFAGTSYLGRGNTLDDASPRNVPDNYWSGIVVSKPDVRSFKADGCFLLEGVNSYGSNAQWAAVYVSNHNSLSDVRVFWAKNSFSQRVWLPGGKGTYSVNIYFTMMSTNTLGYEGDIMGYSRTMLTDRRGVYTFVVENIRDEDGTHLYPSWDINADDPAISSLAQQLVSGVSGESNRCRVVHDFVVTNLQYDYSSTTNEIRKRQDAIAVLSNQMAVCEGYAHIYNALLRSLGIRARYVSGGNHGWSRVLSEGNWWYVDTTWDDPGPNSHLPSNIRWKYFYQSSNTFALDHTFESEHPEKGRPITTRTVHKRVDGRDIVVETVVLPQDG